MKTDLNLLLECLKFQMDNPESQKAALVTIYSICQDNSNACDYFQEIGGLVFVNNLAKSSTHSVVKEASLFTLGVLAENNVYCQQTVCTLELFEDVCAILSNEESLVNLKRMSVYVFLVLVSNNKTGQNLARTSGCIDMLLLLFREIQFTCDMHLSDTEPNHHHQLWTSVCSALCACANNPQNDENQKLCSSAFPHAKDCLLKYTQPQIVRPICSLVGLTVANNNFAQDYFSSVGGLDTLAEVLFHLVGDLQGRQSSMKLAVVVTKTLDACITDNPFCLKSLSKHSIISCLIRLLSHENLESEDRFSIVLTLGHCTENCEANQYELLKSNGLPLMIQVLAESQDDELNKAATFVLQNCRHITERVSTKLKEPSPSELDSASNLTVTEKNMEEYWKKANDMLHKIEFLQQQHNKEKVKRQISANTATLNTCATATLRCSGKIDGDRQAAPRVKNTDVPCRNQAVKSGDSINDAPFRDPVRHKLGQQVKKKHWQPSCESLDTVKQSCPNADFQGDTSVSDSRNSADPLTLCSDLIDREMCGTLGPDVTMNESRCSGCLVKGTTINSRNCSKILHKCLYLCDRHRAILEAEERYKRELKKLLYSSRTSTSHNIAWGTSRRRLSPFILSGAVYVEDGGAWLSIMRVIADTVEMSKPGDLRSCEQRRERVKCQRRSRKNFTAREIAYLLDGVQNLGHRWNSILWSYPFQKGRKNVDLAKKYKKLQMQH
ncbi:telomere repeats-binding bouquet formation protein 1 [Pelodytes ibericus]